MDRPPPAYSEDPDDPFQGINILSDPNLSSTVPPHPSSIILPNSDLANRTWYVLSGTPVVGMTYNWHLTSNIITGISNPGHVAYSSWSEALDAYTHAYNANSIVISNRPSRRSRRRGGTPFHTPQSPAGPSSSDAHMTPSNAPVTPQRPSMPHTPSGTPGAVHGSAYDVSPSSQPTPTAGGHPQHLSQIGSLPTSGSTAPTPTKSAPSKKPAASKVSSSARLRLIREALGETSPTTPPSAPSTGHADDIRARIKALEEELHSYLARHGPVTSPPTPTPANSNVEGRLTALEEAMNLILHREAMAESQQAFQSDSHGPVLSQPLHSLHEAHSPVASQLGSLHAHGPTSPHLALPAEGSSTGPGTIAGEGSPNSTNSRRPTIIVIEDDSDDEEYSFDDLSPEGESQLAALLEAIHENYLANKR